MMGAAPSRPLPATAGAALGGAAARRPWRWLTQLLLRAGMLFSSDGAAGASSLGGDCGAGADPPSCQHSASGGCGGCPGCCMDGADAPDDCCCMWVLGGAKAPHLAPLQLWHGNAGSGWRFGWSSERPTGGMVPAAAPGLVRCCNEPLHCSRHAGGGLAGGPASRRGPSQPGCGSGRLRPGGGGGLQGRGATGLSAASVAAQAMNVKKRGGGACLRRRSGRRNSPHAQSFGLHGALGVTDATPRPREGAATCRSPHWRAPN